MEITTRPPLALSPGIVSPRRANDSRKTINGKVDSATPDRTSKTESGQSYHGDTSDAWNEPLDSGTMTFMSPNPVGPRDLSSRIRLATNL